MSRFREVSPVHFRPECLTWLQTQSPVVWHVVAVDMQFGSGETPLEVLEWMASVQQLNRATAFALLVAFASGIYSFPTSAQSLVTSLHARLGQEFYSHPNFGFGGMEYARELSEAIECFVSDGGLERYPLAIAEFQTAVAIPFDSDGWLYSDGTVCRLA